MLGELPLVEIAKATSPGRPSACNWREKICSNPRSLAMAVREADSLVKATAARA